MNDKHPVRIGMFTPKHTINRDSTSSSSGEEKYRSRPSKPVKNRAEHDERVQNKVTQTDRRLDSLARVLAPTEGKTMCVACGLVDGQLVIGANMPKHESRVSAQQLKTMIATKFDILKRFLKGEITVDQALSRLSREENGRLMQGTARLPVLRDRIRKDLLKIKATHQDKLPETALILIPSLPESKELIPSRESELKWVDRNIEYYANRVSYPSEDREKYASDKQKLVSFQHRRADLRRHPDNIDIHVHAEQLIAKYIIRNKLDKKDLYLGISKLCCVACEHALKEENIRFRGSHNGLYPTFSLLQQVFVSEGRGTDWQQPIDSESEAGGKYLSDNESEVADRNRFFVPSSSEVTVPAAAQVPKPAAYQAQDADIEEGELEEGEILPQAALPTPCKRQATDLEKDPRAQKIRGLGDEQQVAIRVMTK